MTDYLKEDRKKVLQRAKELKEATGISGRRLQSRIADIAALNKIANPNKIYAGKSLNVGGKNYTIQKGDTLTKIAKLYPGAAKSAPAKPAPAKPAPAKPAPAKPAAPTNPGRAGRISGSESTLSQDLQRNAAPPVPAPATVKAPLPPVRPTGIGTTKAPPVSATSKVQAAHTRTARDMIQNRRQANSDIKASKDAANQNKVTPPVKPVNSKFNIRVTPSTSAPAPRAATVRTVDVSVTPPNKTSGMARGPSPDQPPRIPEPKGSTETDKYFSAVNARRSQQNYSQPAASEYKTPAKSKEPEPETKAPGPTAPMMTQTSGSVTTNNASDEPPDNNMKNPSVQDIIDKLKPKQQNESVVNVGSNKYRII